MLEEPTPSPQKREADKREQLHERLTNSPSNKRKQRPCCWYSRAAWMVLVIAFLQGVANTMPAAHIANLSDATFGNNSFSVVGAFQAGRGGIGFLLNSQLGSLSDTLGRRTMAITFLLLSSVEYFVMTCTGSYLAYTIVDTALGWTTMMVMTTFLAGTISDLVPSVARGRTIVLAMQLSIYEAALPLSFASDYVSVRLDFGIAGGALLLAAAVAYFFLPESSPLALRHHQQEHIDEIEEGCATNNENGREQPQQHRPLLAGSSQQEQEQQPDGDRAAVAATYGAVNNSSDHLNTNNSNNTNTEQQFAEEKKSFWEHTKNSLSLLRENRNMLLLFVMACFNTMDQALYSSPMLLYLKDTLHFDKEDQSTFLVTSGSCAVVACFGVIALGNFASNKRILTLALVCNFLIAVGFGFTGFLKDSPLSVTKPVVFGITVLVLPCLLGSPTLNSLAAQSVEADRVGAALGLIGAARIVAMIIAQLMFGQLFQAAKGTAFPSWPFFVGAFMMLVSTTLSFFVVTSANDEEDHTTIALGLDEDRHDDFGDDEE